jgi:hypothetical protein
MDMKNLDTLRNCRDGPPAAGQPPHYPLAFTSVTARAISSSMVRRI